MKKIQDFDLLYFKNMICLSKLYVPEDKVRISDLYLDSDERYQVFEVKAAERPHLLHYSPDTPKNEQRIIPHDDNISIKSNNSTKEEAEEEEELPLIDGCDLLGWRKEGLVHCSDHLQGSLNIGLLSTMFRRDSQWPLLSSVSKSPWIEMKNRMIHASIQKPAAVIDHDEYAEIVTVRLPNGKVANMTKFARDFEENNIPATIVNATVGWKCLINDADHGQLRWSFQNLLRRFGHVNWRFSDTHGEMMCLDTYAKYIFGIEGMMDDSPLGIYDSEFGDESDDPDNPSPTQALVTEYTVPSCFSKDLFEFADSGPRPPFRWILIGPERSGTGMHIDPLYTNAWVTVIEGKKRWMLFPPTVPLEEIGMKKGEPQINSATWFKHYYDKVIDKSWPEEWRPVEVLQNPKETVFVPNGWPHLVLNLELTVAVTHNYASEFGPFEQMWKEVCEMEQEFAKRWLNGLKFHRPDLVERIHDLMK